MLKFSDYCSGGISVDDFCCQILIKLFLNQMLRTILQKKIYPQNSNVRTSSMKKYLKRKNKQKDENENENEKNDKKCDGSKWVQTDSECQYEQYNQYQLSSSIRYTKF